MKEMMWMRPSKLLVTHPDLVPFGVMAKENYMLPVMPHNSLHHHNPAWSCDHADSTKLFVVYVNTNHVSSILQHETLRSWDWPKHHLLQLVWLWRASTMYARPCCTCIYFIVCNVVIHRYYWCTMGKLHRDVIRNTYSHWLDYTCMKNWSIRGVPLPTKLLANIVWYSIKNWPTMALEF